ncbi:MAG TPA: divalent metal cation transporter FieF, partial [Rhodospirillaceae bacterium]|nr:divalent metal cation transporter FieF [Rhodospirillaceae bacterium]
MSLTHLERSHLTQRAAGISLFVALLIIAMQLYAYFMTNAMVVLASVLESVMDAIASATALFALHTAHRPADDNHRYGHGKAEPLVAMAQAAFLAGSGIYFIIQSASRIIHPEPIQQTDLGINIMLISSGIIIALLFYQHRIVLRTQSLSIKADFLHYLNDIIVNGMVILSLWLGSSRDWPWLDGTASIIIAVYILFSAYRLGKTAVGELMDIELGTADRQHILGIMQAHKAVEGVHDLRTRRSGPDIFIEAHVEMAPHMSLQAVHHVTDMIENALRMEFPTAHITLHQEPAGIQDEKLDEQIKR